MDMVSLISKIAADMQKAQERLFVLCIFFGRKIE